MKVSVLAMFATFAVVLSYIESLIPVIGIPGAKLGLANLAIILVIYFFGVKEAILVSIVRILIVCAMFGNMFAVIYSISGALLSLLVMNGLKKLDRLHIPSISIAGGVFHNLGQILVAAVVVENYSVFYYFPALVLLGIITGAANGIVANIIYSRTRNIINKKIH